MNKIKIKCVQFLIKFMLKCYENNLNFLLELKSKSFSPVKLTKTNLFCSQCFPILFIIFIKTLCILIFLHFRPFLLLEKYRIILFLFFAFIFTLRILTFFIAHFLFAIYLIFIIAKTFFIIFTILSIIILMKMSTY